MKKAFVFPGQGAQFVGMGQDLYNSSEVAKLMFDKANIILGFDITKVMFSGEKEDLSQTKVTQPAIYIHSVISAKVLEDFNPDMVAGHSLGEFSALASVGAISFEDGLKLVQKRALAMQEACEENPSSMAVVLGLSDDIVEGVCAEIDGVVVPANYNCPGQLVISGETSSVEKACELLKEKGAKRVLMLAVSGAFHSPIMKSAESKLAKAINETEFVKPSCPVYQNVTTTAVESPSEIKENLIKQLTSAVKWTQSVEQMIVDGATEFVELGPGKVLNGLVKKIDRTVSVEKL